MTAFRENIGVIVVVGILLLCIGQVFARQTGLERRVAVTESKLDRLENWLVADHDTQANWHSDVMKTLGEMSSNQVQTLTVIKHIDLYYRRAELQK